MFDKLVNLVGQHKLIFLDKLLFLIPNFIEIIQIGLFFVSTKFDFLKMVKYTFIS